MNFELLIFKIMKFLIITFIALTIGCAALEDAVGVHREIYLASRDDERAPQQIFGLHEEPLLVVTGRAGDRFTMEVRREDDNRVLHRDRDRAADDFHRLPLNVSLQPDAYLVEVHFEDMTERIWFEVVD